MEEAPMSGTRSHWEKVHTTKAETEVSWYQPHSLRSLELIAAAAPDPAVAIVDIGGGASRLVDDLLARGYSDLTVLDVSDAALAARLGPAFSLTRQAEEIHETPWGSKQKFSYAVFRREA